jgi:hypothetical protein
LGAHVERIADAELGSGSEVLNEAAEAALGGWQGLAAATQILARNVGSVRKVGGKSFGVTAAESAKQWPAGNAGAGFATSVEGERVGIEAEELRLVGKGSKL